MEDNAIWFPPQEQLEEELKRVQRKNRRGKVFRGILCTLLVMIVLAVSVSLLLLPVMQISGESMAPTLQDADIVLAVNDHKYRQGDMIGFHFNDSILIKRVIACSGDWIDLDATGNVFINGKRLDEPYCSSKAVGECNISLPYQIPEGQCFVMGDNRANSVDSRNTAVGCIEDEAVIGRLIWRIWPLNAFGSLCG